MTLTTLVLACFTSLGGLNPTVQANQTRGIRRNAENILMNSSDVTYDEDYPLTIDDQIAVFGNRFYRFSQQNNLLDSELMTRLSNVVPQENGEYYRLDYSPLPNMSDYEYESENRDVFYNNLFINPIFGHGLFNPGEHAPYAALNLFQGDSLYERLLTEGFRRIPGSDVLLPPHTTYDLVIDDDFYDYISARGYERIPFPGGDVLLPPHVTYDLSIGGISNEFGNRNYMYINDDNALCGYLVDHGFERIPFPGGDVLLPPHVTYDLSIVDLYDYLETRGFERIPGSDAIVPPYVNYQAGIFGCDEETFDYVGLDDRSLYEYLREHGFERIPGGDAILKHHTTYSLYGDNFFDYLRTRGYERIPFPGGDVLLPPHVTYDLNGGFEPTNIFHESEYMCLGDGSLYDYLLTRGFEKIPGGDVLLPPHVTYDLSISDLYENLLDRGYQRIPGGDGLLPPHVIYDLNGGNVTGPNTHAYFGLDGESLYEYLLHNGYERIPGGDAILKHHTTYDLVVDNDFFDYLDNRGFERIPFAGRDAILPPHTTYDLLPGQGMTDRFADYAYVGLDDIELFDYLEEKGFERIPGGDVLLPPHVTYDLSIVDLYDYLRTRGYERIPGGDALLPPHVVLNAIGYASYNERLRLGTYDPELVGIEINGELNGNPFAGINVSKDTCIALYNCVATWFNSFEENSFGVVGGDFAAQFDCPWGWSFSEWFNEAIYMLTEIGPWDRAAAVKTINDSYNGVWEELLPLLSRVNDIGAVVDFVIELAGTSSIGILAMMIVSGALGEDCVVGWAFSNEPNANSFVCSPFGDLLD